MDLDLQSIQQARELLRMCSQAQRKFKDADQETVDRIVAAMAAAGERAAESLGRHAHEETGFGRVESKKAKNLFATRTLVDRMRGMKTAGIINKPEAGTIWEVAVPMGVVAALVPSTNPTSTAMYKAIISAKARCGIVMSPHPRAAKCTAAALDVVAQAAYKAGAPKGLFGCMTAISLAGTNELLENDTTDVILATGGTPMVRAAYSKGKPAYGVGAGNVPVYVDRSADIAKAAADVMYGVSFDWGTLCSTERSVVADAPIKAKLIAALKAQGAYFMTPDDAQKLRGILLVKGRLNVDQVGQSPQKIAAMAGFHVPTDCRGLIGEVTEVGKQEPLSMETLSPILSFFVADGWEAGCNRCIEILNFGGIGHTLALHCTNERVIEAFALEKPAMRIVVNTLAALGSVGYTNRLFPSMTLGPGTMGGSITSDNISPMHLINIKRMAFETDPINPPSGPAVGPSYEPQRGARNTSWIDEIEDRLRARAGNLVTPRSAARVRGRAQVTVPERAKPVGGKADAASAPTPPKTKKAPSATTKKVTQQTGTLSEDRIKQLIERFSK